MHVSTATLSSLLIVLSSLEIITLLGLRVVLFFKVVLLIEQLDGLKNETLSG